MKRIEKLTALKQYIEDLKNGNCKGEEYYIELEKQQLTNAVGYGFLDAVRPSSKQDIDFETYYNQTFTDSVDKETIKK